MASTSSQTIEQLYADIVADLVPFYEDAVLLPNQQIIKNSLIVSGSTGSQVRFPLQNQSTTGATITEGNSIEASANYSMAPTSANISFTKKGVASDVNEEALEDGGFELVRNATLSQLSTGIATATDVEGLGVAKSSYTNDDGAGVAAATHTANFVISPEGLAYAAKREPVVKVWYNPDRDRHEFRATVRNGFVSLRSNFGRKISCNATIGSGDANVEALAKSVANLRGANAPVGLDGMYVGLIDPAFEFAINQQLAQVGGSTISSLSDLGNNALRDAMISMIAGVSLYRSNNLPNNA
jgi:hypothetical protein